MNPAIFVELRARRAPMGRQAAKNLAIRRLNTYKTGGLSPLRKGVSFVASSDEASIRSAVPQARSTREMG